MKGSKSDMISCMSKIHTVVFKVGYTYLEHKFIRIMKITRNTCTGLKIDQTVIAA